MIAIRTVYVNLLLPIAAINFRTLLIFWLNFNDPKWDAVPRMLCCCFYSAGVVSWKHLASYLRVSLLLYGIEVFEVGLLVGLRLNESICLWV